MSYNIDDIYERLSDISRYNYTKQYKAVSDILDKPDILHQIKNGIIFEVIYKLSQKYNIDLNQFDKDQFDFMCFALSHVLRYPFDYIDTYY